MEEEYSYTQLILAVVKYTRGRYTVDEIRDVLALIEEYEEEDVSSSAVPSAPSTSASGVTQQVNKKKKKKKKRVARSVM